MSRYRSNTPRQLVRRVSMPRAAISNQPTELEMDVGVPDNVTLPVVMSTGTGTIIDPDLSFSGQHKMLMVPAVDTDLVAAPRTLTLEAERVVVQGALHLDDGLHKLEIPYPSEPNTVLLFDGYEMKWVPFLPPLSEGSSSE